MIHSTIRLRSRYREVHVGTDINMLNLDKESQTSTPPAAKQHNPKGPSTQL